MRRRDFIAGIAGSATAWPLVARAQQDQRIRRIALLMNLAENDAESQRRIAAFRKVLSSLGWTEGKNLQIEFRWGVDANRNRRNAAELVALAPEVIVANAPPSVLALQQESSNVPIVFTAVTDPVAMGIVQSLARPGGNATGFTSAEFGLSAKWLELLKEVAPHVKRVGVFQNPSNQGALPQFTAMQAVAPSFGVELSSIGVRDNSEIERGIIPFAGSVDSGLIVTRTSEAIAHRGLIIKLAAQHRLPAVYPLRFFITDGGLVSYGPDIVDQYRHAAGYVDRILRGEKPSDLPVQAPTKYETVLNLKTAKALGIVVPATVLARADEVIE